MIVAAGTNLSAARGGQRDDRQRAVDHGHAQVSSLGSSPGAGGARAARRVNDPRVRIRRRLALRDLISRRVVRACWQANVTGGEGHDDDQQCSAT